ncbi:MAG TPA: ABC transporter ATP-binding protein [Candidatus Saccharimonadales bacterium]|nr:ABC transporter ATP-binding protein [Candidatus Saccharimonadales bacterium]
MSAIAVEHLGVAIGGREILSGVTIDIPEGKVIGLLGPSGSGKTTLMRTIVGLQKPKTGHVMVFGLLAGSKQLRKEVGYMTQAPSVYGDLTVEENLRYFGTLVGEGKPRISTIMADVDISALGGRLVSGLSGGERARVSLAVAMLAQPPLLVLDEPTVGLDPLLRQQLWQKFHELARGGTTLLVSSHVMDEASRCDGLLLIREGKLLAAGSPSALKAQTKTQSVEEAFIQLVGAKR